MDMESLVLANALLGNPVDTPALEIPLMGGLFRSVKVCRVAAVGAECGVPQSAFDLQADELLELQPCARGVRVYLAAAGGFIPNAGSVRAGDLLECAEVRGGPPRALSRDPSSLDTAVLRVLSGPQGSCGFAELLNSSWRVSPVSDRRGVRLLGSLSGERVELPSEPACVGAIQVTPDGTPIILGPDGPTIGGYPKVAVVISADLAKLGQLTPGAEVSFEPVTHERAREALRAEGKRIGDLLARLRLGL